MGRSIVDTWTGETRQVVGVCRGACRLADRDLRRSLYGFVISPAGVAHLAKEDGDTDCGHDATRGGWLWVE